jgi:hypothetical protein
MAAEAEHVRPLAQPQPGQARPAGELEAGPDELGYMRRQPTGTAVHRQRYAELMTELQRQRNSDDGYWVASSNPEAAEHALGGTVDRGELRRAAVLSDGATRLADRFGLLDWAGLLDVLQRSGPASLIEQVRGAERSDPEDDVGREASATTMPPPCSAASPDVAIGSWSERASRHEDQHATPDAVDDARKKLLYFLKAGPAGGRLRRPPSASSPTHAIVT